MTNFRPARERVRAIEREKVEFNAWLMTRGKGEQECSEARRKERERERKIEVGLRERETVEHGSSGGWRV